MGEGSRIQNSGSAFVLSLVSTALISLVALLAGHFQPLVLLVTGLLLHGVIAGSLLPLQRIGFSIAGSCWGIVVGTAAFHAREALPLEATILLMAFCCGLVLIGLSIGAIFRSLVA